MIKYIKNLIIKYWDIFLYLVVGFLTTVINVLVKFALFKFMGFDTVICTTVAWIVAVIFAFYANKVWVFKSMDFSLKKLFQEIIQFLGCRVGTGLLDLAITEIGVKIFGKNAYYILVIISSILVIILNYIGSKILFSKKER